MASACGLTIVKRFPYRGDTTEEFSNTYWFTGGPPADDAAWLALWTAMTTAEKPLYGATTQIIRGYGYNDDTGHKPGDEGDVAPSVWGIDLRIAPNTVINGSFSAGALYTAPGDSAVWVRWKTSRRTNPGGKAIYLRKYFHPAYHAVQADGDTVAPTWVTNANTFGAKLYDGTLPGARKITTAGVNDTILSHGASPYITTRTLKRRGKREAA
jgi:hypothetical protein